LQVGNLYQVYFCYNIWVFITSNKFGRAVCGMEKLFLEFTAVGDLGEK